MPWYVICTKSKAEFKTAEHLSKHGFEVHCSSIITERKWSNRKKKLKSHCSIL
jgi:hypothetical protein